MTTLDLARHPGRTAAPPGHRWPMLAVLLGGLIDLVFGHPREPGPGPLQCAVHRRLCGAQHVRHLQGWQFQHLPQDEDRPLPRWQQLQCGDKRQAQA